MTFNCSTGSFSPVGIDSQFCSNQGMHYYASALIFDLKFDGCQNGGDSIPYLWVLWVFLGLLVVIVIGVVILCILNRNKDVTKGKSLW